MPDLFADPRCDELDDLFAIMPPRRELSWRLALIGLSEHCRGDAGWKRRVSELQRLMDLEGVDIADILREAEAARAEIVENAR
jgi:hypothetical protein